MAQNKINIAVLLGDPSGIGPELVSKLLSEEITNKANIIIIGEKNIFESGSKISGITHNLNFVENSVKIVPTSFKMSPETPLGGVLGPYWPQDGPKSAKQNVKM